MEKSQRKGVQGVEDNHLNTIAAEGLVSPGL